MSATAREILKGVFGYPDFRGEQEAVIEHVLGGGDCLVVMPTGGGKSLCYQIPPLIRGRVGVVVSPLIALMRDQVSALRQLGIRAAFLNSTPVGVRGPVGSRRAWPRATSTCSMSRPSAWCRSARSPYWTALESASGRSTRLTAFRSGVTISGPSICSWTCSGGATPGCRGSPAQPRPTSARAGRS